MADAPTTTTPTSTPTAAGTTGATTTPTTTTPSTTTTPDSQKTELTGIAKAMGDFDAIISPKKSADKNATPTKDDGKGKDVPKAEEQVDWEKAPPKLKGAFFKTKREFEGKISDYEKRIKEIESKPRESSEDAKLVEKYKNEINDLREKTKTEVNELKERIAASDYKNSPQFKKDYVDRWNSEYKNTVDGIARLQITVPGKDGADPTQRPATQADFDRILRMSPEEQDIALDAFGPHKHRVVARILELNRIEQSANNAIAEHAKNAELSAKELEAKAQKDKLEYDRLFQLSEAEIKKTWPQFFSEADGDAEVNAAIQKGYSYVDELLNKANTLPLEDRAAHNAVIRARAAAMPRLALELNRAKSEIESLKKELEKFQSSDPGKGGEHHDEPTTTKEEPRGIEAMASKFINV